MLLCKSDTIEIEALPLGQPAAKTSAATTAEGITPLSSEAIRSDSLNHAALSFEEIGRIIVDKVPDSKSGGPGVEVFTEIERAIVSAALKRTKGNKQAAANLLGLYRPRLYSMIKKHNLMNSSQQNREGSSESGATG